MNATNLWEAFEQSTAVARARPALVFAKDTVTFDELKTAAERCAAWLHAQTIGRGEIVALQLPKRPETYALWLACIRQGIPYVFIDPRNPLERTRAIVKRLAPRLLISVAAEQDEPLATHATVKLLADQDWRAWLAGLADTPPPRPATIHGLDPAYVMFTSGSTGEPKGAVIPHQGILSLMRWVGRRISAPGERRFSNLNPLHFDNAVFDLYGGLLNGSTLVPVETSQLPNPSQWTRVLRDGGAELIFAVPTLFQTLARLNLLNPERLPQARVFVFGGEGYPVADLARFHARFVGQARLVNVYGPTETSCICSSHDIDGTSLADAETKFPSLGRMHTDFDYAILDEEGKELPRGAPGELWIGGTNVGLGYYNNPEETARRFRQDPRQTKFRSIWYRSGDLVREDEEGLLWFCGRADNQVKIRGHRIELEELELAIEGYSGVTRAIAVAIPGEDGLELHVAYAAEAAADEAELKALCRERLPVYMQPARIVWMRGLPVNANGKVDRKAVAALLAGQP